MPDTMLAAPAAGPKPAAADTEAPAFAHDDSSYASFFTSSSEPSNCPG